MNLANFNLWVQFKRAATFFAKYAALSLYVCTRRGKSKLEIVRLSSDIPKKNGMIVAAHHERWEDGIVIAAKTKRRLNWIITTKYWDKDNLWQRSLKRILMCMGFIPIDYLKKKGIDLFQYVTNLLDNGETIVIFPEYKLREERKDKKFGAAKDGVIKIVKYAEKKLKKKIPICPIGINYLKKEDKVKAYVKVGKLFYIKKREDINLAMNRLMKEIRGLSTAKNG